MIAVQVRLSLWLGQVMIMITLDYAWWLLYVRLGTFGQVKLGYDNDNVRLCLVVTLRQVRYVCLGQVRLGYVRLGLVTLGQVRLGQVRLGQVRLGYICKQSVSAAETTAFALVYAFSSYFLYASRCLCSASNRQSVSAAETTAVALVYAFSSYFLHASRCLCSVIDR